MDVHLWFKQVLPTVTSNLSFVKALRIVVCTRSCPTHASSKLHVLVKVSVGICLALLYCC